MFEELSMCKPEENRCDLPEFGVIISMTEDQYCWGDSDGICCLYPDLFQKVYVAVRRSLIQAKILYK